MIAIIAANNLYCSPYAHIYREILEDMGKDYEILFMNRENLPEEETAKHHGLAWRKLPFGGGLFEKLYNYLRFRRFILDRARGGRYSFLVVLTAMPALLLADRLVTAYRCRYLTDIRDITRENNPLFRALEHLVFRRGAMTAVSSPAFAGYLPKGTAYALCHNISPKRLLGEEGSERAALRRSSPIVIGYVGQISYPESCLALAELVQRDRRFALYFYGGDRSGRVAPYVNALAADNVVMKGRYRPEEKPGICRSVDILFNAYGNGSPLLDAAVSNKYYDALLHRKPVLNSPGTLMHRSLAPISYVFDHRRETSLDALYDWYHGLDNEAVDAFCLSALMKVRRDVEQFHNALAHALGAGRA